MKRTLISAATLLSILFAATSPAFAQFNGDRARNAPAAPTAEVEYTDKEGKVRKRVETQQIARDEYGNAAGNQYDLAIDGAFEGQTVAVLHFYTGENFDFSLPRQALKEKGFSVYRWSNKAPSPQELARGLEKACQLWIISSEQRHLTDEHLKVIKEFFDSGRGVYIWGDNEPYYADANAVAQALFAGEMRGNLPGTVSVGIRTGNEKVGLIANHDITTGLEHLYEGITIATLQPNDALTPLLYGSAGNLVTAFFDHQGRRAILDGGFTRLYINWDTAGTARYVKNAAAWLVNYERFGNSVVADKYRKEIATER
jgi:hypothetical protein